MRDCLLKRVLLRIYHSSLDAKLNLENKIDDLYTHLYVKYYPINSKKILFMNFSGNGYGESPKYIAEEIYRQRLDVDLVWLVKNDCVEVPSYIRKVRYLSNKAKRERSTAKVIITNIRNDYYIPKKKGQVYLQTWHGGMGFKKVEGEAEELLELDYINRARIDGQESDAIISACGSQTEEYKKYFWLSDNTEILEIGQPRCDPLFTQYTQTIVEKVYRFFGLNEGVKLILYVPTFRDNDTGDAYDLGYEEVLSSFEKRFGQKCVMLVRLHPHVIKLCSVVEYSDCVINASIYPDVHELYIAADALITDYSSCAFDFALLDKPVFICALDYDRYVKMRGFTLHYNSSPFPKCYSSRELIESIDGFNEDEYLRRLKKYKEEEWKPFDDGHASERAVAWIKDKL